METIIAALITALATMIVMHFTNSSKVDKLTKQLDSLKTAAEKKHERRESEHKDLSLGHKDLSSEHKELAREHRDLKDEIHRVITYQESEKTARELLSKKIPEVSALVEMITAVYDNSKNLQLQVDKLQIDNQKLNLTVQSLKQENMQLRTQINEHQINNEMDSMNLFDDLER